MYLEVFKQSVQVIFIIPTQLPNFNSPIWQAAFRSEKWQTQNN